MTLFLFTEEFVWHPPKTQENCTTLVAFAQASTCTRAFQQCSQPTQALSNTHIEECRHAILEEIVVEVQCEMEMGLEERDMILEGSWNEVGTFEKFRGMERQKQKRKHAVQETSCKQSR